LAKLDTDKALQLWAKEQLDIQRVKIAALTVEKPNAQGARLNDINRKLGEATYQLLFDISAQRDVVGNSVALRIDGAGGALVSKVHVVLDNKILSDDTLAMPSVSYQRDYRQVGIAAPGVAHILKVAGTDSKGSTFAA
jgi:hypothetical protein